MGRGESGARVLGEAGARREGGEGQAHPQASSRLTPREPVTFRM